MAVYDLAFSTCCAAASLPALSMDSFLSLHWLFPSPKLLSLQIAAFLSVSSNSGLKCHLLRKAFPNPNQKSPQIKSDPSHSEIKMSFITHYFNYTIHHYLIVSVYIFGEGFIPLLECNLICFVPC